VRKIALRLRESFWFLSAVLGLLALFLSQGLVSLDRFLLDQGAFVLWPLSAADSRAILSIIGTSTLTVAGTSFSITISVLATTSSTYGPRLVRNFIADRANQLVLAVFTSTFLYSLLVLRSVRSETDDGAAFTPSTAVHFAVLLAVVDVAFLVFFIHHIAKSVQITTLQKQVQDDLTAVVETIYGDAAEKARTTIRPKTPMFSPPSDARTAVTAKFSGYIQDVNLSSLVAFAKRHDCVIEVCAMPGTHLIADETLVSVIGPTELGDQMVRTLRGAFTLGNSRTPNQDVRFALQQLVEIAVRGLASGSNDPYTAVSALDLSAKALVPLWKGQPAPVHYPDSDGVPRLVAQWPEPDELIALVFVGVTTYGGEHPIVVAAALGLADRLVRARPERASVIAQLTEKLHNTRTG
jgi:uncharacterized membrane protein